jgi:hypothetical protein
MKEFYLQSKCYMGWGVNELTSRCILYSMPLIEENLIGQLDEGNWYTNHGPFDVMVRLNVKPV